jgi:ribosomal protein L11 methyltransferase
VIRLAIRVRREHAELVLAELLELAPSGVEEARAGEDVVEYAVYGAPGELPELPDLRAAASRAGEALVEVSTSEIADDWAERWKQFHRPVLISPPTGPDHGVVPALYVHPPWELLTPRPDTREIVIDPAQAFGTGAHATTRLCLELLLELAATNSARGAVLDLGAGSGVLAIAAAHLGFGPVLALDYDPLSVEATEKNAVANHVQVEARRFDLREQTIPQASVVLANLLGPLLLDLAAGLSTPPDTLIASGLLIEETEAVLDAFRAHGMCERATREQGEWVALWLGRD